MPGAKPMSPRPSLKAIRSQRRACHSCPGAPRGAGSRRWSFARVSFRGGPKAGTHPGMGGEWSGTPTVLYREVLFRWEPEGGNRPGNERTMSERLKRAAPALYEVHRLRVEWSRGDHRIIELRRVANPSAATGGRVVRRRAGRR